MNRRFRLFGLATLAAVLMTPALAQAPPRGKPPLVPGKAMRNPKACTHTRATVGEGGSPATPRGTLSRQLAQSNGVICPPPDVDPHLDRPAPSRGRMPVIPPPGTPSGDRGAATK